MARYPVDPYDRLWAPWRILGLGSDVFGFGKFQDSEDDAFEVPAAVMKTAITPLNASNNIFFSFNAASNQVDSTLWYTHHLSTSQQCNIMRSYVLLNLN